MTPAGTHVRAGRRCSFGAVLPGRSARPRNAAPACPARRGAQEETAADEDTCGDPSVSRCSHRFRGGSARRGRRVRGGNHLHQAHRPDHPAVVRELSPAGRIRPDVADDLRRGAALGAGHQAADGDPRDAPLVHRARRGRPALQERPVVERRGDRDGGALGRQRRPARQPGRHAAAPRVPRPHAVGHRRAGPDRRGAGGARQGGRPRLPPRARPGGDRPDRGPLHRRRGGEGDPARRQRVQEGRGAGDEPLHPAPCRHPGARIRHGRPRRLLSDLRGRTERDRLSGGHRRPPAGRLRADLHGAHALGRPRHPGPRRRGIQVPSAGVRAEVQPVGLQLRARRRQQRARGSRPAARDRRPSATTTSRR